MVGEMISMVELLLFPPKILPKAEPVEDPLKSRRGNPKPNHQLANGAKVAAARKRYQAVMGEEWVPTIVIETRMGKVRNTAYDTLMKFVERGELLRRPLGDKPYNRRSGYEWKWVEK